jgi:hypothetical protein
MKTPDTTSKKGQGKPKKNPGDSPKAAALDPCGKPQAEEAARLEDSDEACDEGVH